MLKIRLQRIGRINSPAYRIVVTEHARAAQAGKFVEKLGTYNPKSKERTLNADRVKYWMSVGAKPSDTMHNMLVSLGIVGGKKINVLPAFKAPEAPAEEAAPAPVAEVAAEEEVGGAVTEATAETAAEDVIESPNPEAAEEAKEVEADIEKAA